MRACFEESKFAFVYAHWTNFLQTQIYSSRCREDICTDKYDNIYSHMSYKYRQIYTYTHECVSRDTLCFASVYTVNRCIRILSSFQEDIFQ